MRYVQSSEKILSLAVLSNILEKRQNATIVHCHGVFDLVHIGHIRHFQEAKSLGDILVVTITPDEFVNKGPHRPVFSAKLRAESLAALEVIDYVAVNQWPTAVEIIKLLKPDIYVKGSEYRDINNDKTGKIIDEEKAVNSCGGRIHFTDDIVYSSSTLLNDFFSPFPEEVQRYLRNFSRQYDINDVLHYLENAQTVNVLAVGETILDEYVFCDTLGKSGKEPILAARCAGSEMYAGGILAIGNNLAAFTDNVSLLSSLGDKDSNKNFIQQNIVPVIKPHFINHEGPTIVKRRYVEQYPFQKLFEVYHMSNNDDRPEPHEKFRENLEELLPQADLVIVADYGHGLIDQKTAALICEKAKLLAVNTQVNAGNYGFNTVSKYTGADFICISEKELRLETRCRNGDIKKLMGNASEHLQCPKLLITKGKEGCICYDQHTGFHRIPAFTGKIVDRIGSGDTMLALSSLCVAQKAPLEIAGFLGNVAGALAVGTICNKTSLEKIPMMKNIISMLK
ncbi:PfkB family carbohydrate kinase [uncultured Desulfobacter sp.]|uniref:PfkB family carbohydrate kinase n=1 Tax=uncultured Desulfobacter sp. TaxID=240139 RepID=UPI0029F49B52|nr:PfkB family carbohydrate kinase [uncultured Desulfobacter sp.]